MVLLCAFFFIQIEFAIAFHMLGRLSELFKKIARETDCENALNTKDGRDENEQIGRN